MAASSLLLAAVAAVTSALVLPAASASALFRPSAASGLRDAQLLRGLSSQWQQPAVTWVPPQQQQATTWFQQQQQQQPASTSSEQLRVLKRDFLELQCNGIYQPSSLARLERVCEDCYNVYREPEIYGFCR